MSIIDMKIYVKRINILLSELVYLKPCREKNVPFLYYGAGAGSGLSDGLGAGLSNGEGSGVGDGLSVGAGDSDGDGLGATLSEGLGDGEGLSVGAGLSDGEGSGEKTADSEEKELRNRENSNDGAIITLYTLA